MPGRHSRTSDLPPVRQFVGQKAAPCGDPNRNPLDVAGRINDLINCYLIYAGQAINAVLPQVVIGLLALVVMIIAAYVFLKG